MFEETNYNCRNLCALTTFTDDAGDNAPYPLYVFWDVYDETQTLICNEGQALQFVDRNQAHLYDIPANLLPAWDLGLQALTKTNAKTDVLK